MGLDTISTVETRNVSASATAVGLFSHKATARLRYVFNDSSAILYLKFGAGASATSHTVQVAAGGFYEFPFRPLYNGQVTGAWASATGAARLTEG